MRSELLLQGTENNGVLAEGIPAVSVVVPMYNEVESLPDLIEAIASTLSYSQINYEIILVDDGSTDGSAQLLKQAQT